ncbi:MAG: AAA family ATPase [Phycisphaerae bacterium]|nr:AAA family ATPase [Phycisphaerae bacterium]
MYCDHFDLALLPFNNTPDPRFFYNTPDHEEALASLLYAATERKGYALVTGEVGSGKTLLSRLLLSRLPAGTQTAVITNSRLSGAELLTAICREYQLPLEPGATVAEASHLLEQFLLEQYARDRLVIVVLDEAQNLPPDAFEELRLLGNLEAEDAKLLQVLVLGQPELQATIRRPELRQLRQRLFRTFHLRALTREQTGGYIGHRLEVAGATRELFTPDAIDAIYRASQGVPRLINQTCDNALLAAFGAGRDQVTHDIVRECIEADEAPAIAPRLAARVPDAAPTETAPSNPPATRATAIGDVAAEKLLRRLTEIESRIESLTDRVRSPRENEQVAHRDLQKIRAIRADAEAMLAEAASAVESIRTGSVDALRDGAARLGVSGEQAQAVQSATSSLRAELEAEASRLVDEIRMHADAERRRTSEFVRAEQERLEPLRKDLDALVKSVLEEARTADQRAVEAARHARDSVGASESGVAALSEAARRRSEAALTGLANFVLAARTRCESASAQVSQSFVEAKVEIDAARAQLEKARRAVESDAESTRGKLLALVDEARRVFGTTRGQLEASIRQLQQRIDEQNRRIEELHCQAAVTSGRSISEVQASIAAAAAEAQRVRSELESAAALAVSRVQESTQQMSAATAACEADVAAMRRQAASVRDEIARQLAEARTQSESLLAEQAQQIETIRRRSAQATAGVRDEAASIREAFATELAAIRTRAEQEAEQALASIDQRLGARKSQATEIHERMEQTVRTMQARARELQEQLEKDIARISGPLEFAREMKDGVGRLTSARDALRREITEDETRVATLVELTRNEVERLTGALGTLQSELRSELATAREQTESDRRTARAAASRMVAGLNSLLGRATRRVEQIEGRLSGLLQRADARTAEFSQLAEDICRRLDSTMTTLRDTAALLQTQHEEQASRFRTELTDAVAKAQEEVGLVERRIETMLVQVRAASAEFESRVTTLRDSAVGDLDAVRGELSRTVATAESTAELLRQETAGMREELAGSTARARQSLHEAIERTQVAGERLQRQGGEVVETVRAELERLAGESETLRLEIGSAHDEIVRATEAAESRLRQTAAGITSQIESLRDATNRDAEGNVRRLAGLREQIEGGADRVRTSAAALLQQVQSGSDALRQRADELLAGAQSGAARISEEAAALLSGARTTAERFEQQAAALLQRAEQATEAIRAEAGAIRQRLDEDRERFCETTGVLAEKADRANEKSEELLRRAAQTESQARELLSMPTRIIAEAEQRSGELRKMADAVSEIIERLRNAGTSARQQTEQVRHATAVADERMAQLAQHSARLGQLVGIIRQLYGAMDARIDHLRERLDRADDLCRSIPHEINSLRDALGTERRTAPHTELRGARDGQPGDGADANDSSVAVAAAPSTSKVRTRAAAPKTARLKPPNLSELVRKNQKLNEWLREAIAESKQSDAPSAKDGI